MVVLKKRVKNKATLFLRELNLEVKTMFKSVCVRRGDSMQHVIEALMRFYLTNPSGIEKELKRTKQVRQPAPIRRTQ